MPKGSEVRKDHEFTHSGFVLFDPEDETFFDCYVEAGPATPLKSGVVTIGSLAYIECYLNEKMRAVGQADPKKSEYRKGLREYLDTLLCVPVFNAGENTSMQIDDLELDFTTTIEVGDAFSVKVQKEEYTTYKLKRGY